MTVVDLSAVSFFGSTGLTATPKYGQYGDGVIYTNTGYPDFMPNAGGVPIELDPAKYYLVRVKYDPASIHDGGGRGFWMSPLRPGSIDTDYTNGALYGTLYNNDNPTANDSVCVIGPGLHGWDTYVAAGYTAFYFETNHTGAVSDIEIVEATKTTIDLTTAYLADNASLSGTSIVPTTGVGTSASTFILAAPVIAAGGYMLASVGGNYALGFGDIWSAPSADAAGYAVISHSIYYAHNTSTGTVTGSPYAHSTPQGLYGGSGLWDWDAAVAAGEGYLAFNPVHFTSIDSIDLYSSGTPAPPATVTGTTQRALTAVNGGDVPATAGVMDLTIADDTQYRAPTSVQVILTDAAPGETVNFTLDSSSTVLWTATADSAGSLFLVSISIPPTVDSTDVLAGTHTLHATGVTSGRTASDTFTLARDPSPWPAVQSLDVDPVVVPGRGNSWVLQDAKPGGLGSWIMHPSPTSMSEPEMSKTVDVDHSTHPLDGQYRIHATEDSAKEWTWSGYCPDKTFYDQLVAYADLNRRIWVIDHRGRAWKSTILRADLKARKRQIMDDGSPQDWAHDYTVTAIVYDVISWEPV